MRTFCWRTSEELRLPSPNKPWPPSHRSTQQLPKIGEYALLRINNPPKLGRQFENGVDKIKDFNAAKTMVQLEDSNGLCWCESVGNIRKYPEIMLSPGHCTLSVQ